MLTFGGHRLQRVIPGVDKGAVAGSSLLHQLGSEFLVADSTARHLSSWLEVRLFKKKIHGAERFILKTSISDFFIIRIQNRLKKNQHSSVRLKFASAMLQSTKRTRLLYRLW